MNKKTFLFAILLLLIPVLTACRIDLAGQEEFARSAAEKMRSQSAKEEDSLGDSNEKETSVEANAEPTKKAPIGEPTYKLEGQATLNGSEISIQGKTNIPPGAIVFARLRRYKSDAELEDIKNYRVEPFSNTDGDVYMEVLSDGTFSSRGRFERRNLSLRYRLELIFLPEIAQEGTRERIIEELGSLDNLSGMVPIETLTRNSFKEPVVPGYIKYANVLKQNEEGGDGVTIEFVSPENLPN
ncbi:hypothetical protein FZC78_03390 [Rossellomorea vietnamensis]|uniref:Lipoprotein n=1 Tax=Rossellomorea vietnamensis TaxID=218284 RepID=A0A5D4NXL3_9BACI|nr:hypothetical protein [Rossellomorea vietnamensis]TYS18589.1 hypothetical protein FZC78_03390 [Rossellomorea vietnamensis]